MSIHKKFDLELYKKYDPAKNLIINFFKKKNKKIELHQNKYDVDLILENKYYVEVQVKNHFTGEMPNFKNPWLHIESRKEKFLFKDKPTLFCILNREKTHAIFVSSATIKKCEKKEIPNKQISRGEYFYIVPLKYTKVLKIN